MSTLFPFNYFASLLSPRKMFAGRHALRWWQMLFILLFLLALNLLAVPLYFQKQDTLLLEQYLPKSAKLLADPKLQQAAHAYRFKDQSYDHLPQKKLIAKDDKILLALNETTATAQKYAVAVVLQDQAFVLHEKGVTYRVFYQAKYRPDRGVLKTQLTKTWYQQNKAAITFSMMSLVAMIMLMTDLLFILGGAFFLWLTRNSPLNDITSFKEAANLMLNILGPASLLSALGGLISFNIANIMLLQTFTLTVLFLLVYAKTRFKDQA